MSQLLLDPTQAGRVPGIGRGGHVGREVHPAGEEALQAHHPGGRGMEGARRTGRRVGRRGQGAQEEAPAPATQGAVGEERGWARECGAQTRRSSREFAVEGV